MEEKIKALPLSQPQVKLLEKYNHILVEKNQIMNLTAHKTEEESLLNNIYDSLLFLDVFKQVIKDITSAHRKDLQNFIGSRGHSCSPLMLDIGSGGGCPAVPLKIACSELDITMLDSVNKKVEFLNSAVKELELENIIAVHTRVEDYAKSHREKFDLVTARAVAELPTLLEYTLPFVKTSGLVFAFKGKNWQTETEQSTAALKILGGSIMEIKTALLHDDVQRSLIIIKKTHSTDKKYPRGKNLPRLNPLK